MDDDAINCINASENLEQVHNILQEFLKNNSGSFTFPDLCVDNRRVLLWTALFQRLQYVESAPVHTLCLTIIRILSRDKTDLENLICEKWISILIDKSGLYQLACLDDDAMVPEALPPGDIMEEALKCLCNIVFNSQMACAICASKTVAQGLIARLKIYKNMPYKGDIMLYDMKLLFILTALRPDIRNKVKDELHGMDYLISCENELLAEATSKMDVACASVDPIDQESHECYLTDQQHAVLGQILKVQFNLVLHHGSENVISEEDDHIYLKLIPVLTALLYAHTSSEEKSMELRSDVANLLTNVPPEYYKYLTPDLAEGETAQYTYDGKNVDALQALVQLMQHLLTHTTNTKNQYENLSPILTVMIKSSRGSRAHRKYLRQVVLPPLRDVSKPPEKGDALRNQLCRLLTTPVSSVRDLVAEFLSVLCKEKVSRLVKYTGFGNAAGHLAQKGLLSGRQAGQYSSSSDDSDTEEYIEAQPNIDPVVGCTRPPRTNPFEGMSEEQKEYEAMKLVNLFDKLSSSGLMQPARIGEDGRPEPISHVLELRENLPNRPKS